MDDRPDGGHEEGCFCGTVTVGERGQIVIPADVRKALGLHPGQKLLVWQHPSGKGIMVFPLESVRNFLDMVLNSLEHADDHTGSAEETHEQE